MQKRCVNNYFTGLFHDLPEVLTRDIISPVKRSVEGLSDLIKGYEKEQMEKEVYGLIPEEWHPEIKMFTEDEFDSVVTINGKKKNSAAKRSTRRITTIGSIRKMENLLRQPIASPDS